MHKSGGVQERTAFGFHASPTGPQLPPNRVGGLLPIAGQPRTDLRPISQNEFHGSRRCGSAQIGDKVDDRIVNLMTNGRDDRDTRGHDGPRHDLFVECPEVFERPSPASHDQHVEATKFIQFRDCLGDLCRSPNPLDSDGVQQQLNIRPAPVRDLNDISDRRSRR